MIDKSKNMFGKKHFVLLVLIFMNVLATSCKGEKVSERGTINTETEIGQESTDKLIETDASLEEVLAAVEKVKKEVETKPSEKTVELEKPEVEIVNNKEIRENNPQTTKKEEPVKEAAYPNNAEVVVNETNINKEVVDEMQTKEELQTKEVVEVETKTENEEKVMPVAEVTEEKSTTKPPFDIHHEFDKILRTHVSENGQVNYKGIKGDKDRLENYLALVSNNLPKSSASNEEKLAYWINVYNAYTIKMIVDNYPVSSITDLENGKPWDKKWIKISGQTYSLNQIENEIIRPTFKEPRIHFAVNCAAKSCPPIMNRTWKASTLEADFEKATKAFINNTQYNSISDGNAQVSKIFEWYKEDFGDLKAYLSKYSGEEVKNVSFKEYDWSLNN